MKFTITKFEAVSNRMYGQFYYNIEWSNGPGFPEWTIQDRIDPNKINIGDLIDKSFTLDELNKIMKYGI